MNRIFLTTTASLAPIWIGGLAPLVIHIATRFQTSMPYIRKITAPCKMPCYHSHWKRFHFQCFSDASPAPLLFYECGCLSISANCPRNAFRFLRACNSLFLAIRNRQQWTWKRKWFCAINFVGKSLSMWYL